MSENSKAVFLSYASQDAEAARRICEALRAVGVEVWFDQNELVGGDAWDAKIRKQIAECALFVPIISAHTQARKEGYFRLEWRLAAQRTHMMSESVAFLLPVVIDATRDAEADVPAEFKAVQWTRLPVGEALEKFCARVQALLDGRAELQPAPDAAERRLKLRATPEAGRHFPAAAWVAIAAVVVGAVSYFVFRPGTNMGAEARPLTSEKSQANEPLTEAQKLTRQARALIEDDPLAVRENYLAAERLCQRAVTLDPADSDAWAVFARAGMALIADYYDRSPGRLENVRSRAETALRLQPDSIEAGLAIARYELFSLPRGAAEAPIARLQGLVERAPTDRRLLELLAAVEFSGWRREQAEGWAQRAEALPGGSPAAMLSRARYHMARNEIGESHDWIARSLAVKPTTYGYFMQLSSLLHMQGDLDAARTALGKVPPSLLQEDAIALQAFQVAYWSRQFDRAAELLGSLPRDFLEGNNIFYPKGFLVGEALYFVGKTRAAELQYRAALQVVEQRLTAEPNSGRLSLWKGKLLARLGQSEDARRCFEAAGELGVEFARWSALWRAEQAVLLGRVDEAIAASDKAMEGTAYRSYTLSQLRYDPLFDPLRKDPRFQAVIAGGLKWLDEVKVVRKHDAERSSAAEASRPAAPEQSVAVLAFANLSDDKSNEYFSDGISEELLNVLAKVPGLKVSARTSAFHFKGKDTPIPEIAQKLGVAYVVEGSVRKAGDKVRITAQLIKAADGFHVWSDNFNRDLKDIFAVQDEIAGLIAQQLSLKLGVSSAAATASVNPQAFELYMQARQAWNRRLPDDLNRAEALLSEALMIDPRFARAHAAMADVWQTRGSQSGTIGRFGQRGSAEIGRVLAKIGEAIELDPKSADAHAALGGAQWQNWDIPAAERSFRRAIEINPNHATAHQWLGRLLEGEGRIEEATVALRRAMELDPLSPIIASNLAARLAYAGFYREAITVADRALTLQPDSTDARVAKANALLGLGRRGDAAALARLPASEDNRLARNRSRILAAAGESAEALRLLAQPDAMGASAVATLLELGQRREALAALDPATLPVTYVGTLLTIPSLDPIRDAPEFRRFLATLGLANAHARAQAWRAAHPPEKPEATP